VDDVLDALARARPDLAAVCEAGPGAGTRQRAGTRVPRPPHRYSGRTAMHAARTVHEPRSPADQEAPLTFSMEGYRPRDPGALLSYTWAPGWNSNQSIYKFQAEVAGPLRGGPAGVRLALGEVRGLPAPGSVAVPGPFSESQRFVAVPLQDVFGSDELSALAPALAARSPRPCAVLAPADAERLGVRAGQGVRVANAHGAESFAARLEPALRPGTVGLVQGMTGTLYLEPGATLTVTADPDYLPPSDGVIARG
jgi:NADH-quinone oxidoreductase subunit G